MSIGDYNIVHRLVCFTKGQTISPNDSIREEETDYQTLRAEFRYVYFEELCMFFSLLHSHPPLNYANERKQNKNIIPSYFPIVIEKGDNDVRP